MINKEWSNSYLMNMILLSLSGGRKHDIYTVEADVLDRIKVFRQSSPMQPSKPGALLNPPFMTAIATLIARNMVILIEPEDETVVYLQRVPKKKADGVYE